jgi:hypothetical protein
LNGTDEQDEMFRWQCRAHGQPTANGGCPWHIHLGVAIVQCFILHFEFSEGGQMAWGTLISLLLRALPDILFLWRRRAEQNDREAIHDDIQEFRGALVGDPQNGSGADLDRAAELLERRVREAASDLRSGRSQTGKA